VAELRTTWTELLSELDARAPGTRAAIRPPRLDGAAAIERSLGIELTDEVRTWFGLHDGTGWSFAGGLLIPGQFLLGVEDVIKITTRWRNICAELRMAPGLTELTSKDPTVAGNMAGTWLPDYLGISDDTCGGNNFVDLRGGPLRGCVRFYMDEQAEEFEDVVAESLADLVQRVLTSVRTGAPCGGYGVPAFRDGILEWVDG
jgi:cell wall assembly regulator SMI1